MKVCNFCYTGNQDSAAACHGCGKKLVPLAAGVSTRGKLALAGTVVLVVGLAAFYFARRDSLPPSGAGSGTAQLPVPPAANTDESATVSELPAADPKNSLVPPVVKPASIEPGQKPVAVSPVKPPGIPSSDPVGRNASPLNTPVAPKPRKRLGRQTPDTAEIIRGRSDASMQDAADAAEARYGDLLWHNMLADFNRTGGAARLSEDENYFIAVRVDTELGQVELVKIPEKLDAAVKNRWAMAAAKCSGSLFCPKELKEKWGRYLNFRFYVGKPSEQGAAR